MKIELSLRELKVLTKWLRMQNAVAALTTDVSLEERIVQVIKNWQSVQDGKPMPLWRLERKLRTAKTELRPVLDQLVANGDIAYIHIPTNGRPTGGYYLTKNENTGVAKS
jgi:predicted ArsR family transcriptional regulator